MELWLVLVAAASWALLVGQVTRADYTAAVLEHKAISWLLPFVNKEQAKAIISLNLDVFEYETSVAASKGADIIVFPEYGITGFIEEERDYAIPFLEHVPNPNFRHPAAYIPCEEEYSPNITVQYRLSCMAIKQKITIVANLATVQHCDLQTDPNCPDDGRYQYNTDVAFTSNGQLVARYDKENLYSGEAKVFNPGNESTNVAAFRTSFGYFGLFTCFDILFANPANRLVYTLGVDTMVFPTAWLNELPLLSAAEYQQAWSLSYGVNLLASNEHFPIAQMTGSGIYSPVSGAVTYTYDMMSITGKLLIGKVKSSNATSKASKQTSKHNSSHKLLSDEVVADAAANAGIVSSILSGLPQQNGDTENMQKSASSESHSKRELYIMQKDDRFATKTPKYFTSMMNNDLYNFTLLEGTQGHASVCNNGICCQVDFTRETDSELYALAAFDGLHTMNGQYYIQCCGLVRCMSNKPEDCGAEMSTATTIFPKFNLQMEGQSTETKLFPEVLTTGVAMPSVRVGWDFSKAADNIWSLGEGLKEPLLAANIFGRWYSRD